MRNETNLPSISGYRAAGLLVGEVYSRLLIRGQRG
jgi:hypothetical protein